MKLNEILNTQRVPYKWLNDKLGTFEFSGKSFGIVLENENIDIVTRIVSVVNILFGIIIDDNKEITPGNISTDLTNLGNPRTVLSTVGSACINNPHIHAYDIIILAASDQTRHKRARIYALGLMELNTHLPEYKFNYTAHPKGSVLTITSKLELSQTEIEYVGNQW